MSSGSTYSLWNDNNETTSLAITQGLQYKSNKCDKNKYLNLNLQLINETYTMNNNNNNYNNNYNTVEGFEGILGPTQANVKNQQEEQQHILLENKFNSSLSEYALAQRNLMDKTQKYVSTGSGADQRN